MRKKNLPLHQECQHALPVASNLLDGLDLGMEGARCFAEYLQCQVMWQLLKHLDRGQNSEGATIHIRLWHF